MKTIDDEIIEKIALAAKKYNGWLVQHLNRTNPNDHHNIEEYQKLICSELNKTATYYYDWDLECQINPLVKDRIDIYGKPKNKNDKIWIIELDATRHDQIAAKYLSRVSIIDKNKKFVYVSILYPATKGTVNTAQKYIRYANINANRLKKSKAIGIYAHVNKTMTKSGGQGYVEIWDYNKNSLYVIKQINNNKIKGMAACAKKAIEEYIRRQMAKGKVYYFEDLEKAFNSRFTIISKNVGKSRYRNTGLQLPRRNGQPETVFTYTQWRSTDITWEYFTDLCKEYNINIERVWERV